jgi:pyrroloquinoline quinone biosynthesis protein B
MTCVSKILITIFLFCLDSVLGQPVLKESSYGSVKLIVLGTVQDGGSPHIGCERSCCVELYNAPNLERKVVSLGLLDETSGKSFLIEASPDLVSQWNMLSKLSGGSITQPSGIMLTHAHIGHYTGLMYLGRESLNSNRMPVFVMPKMAAFLMNNGPWNQLIALNNIEIMPLYSEEIAHLTPQLSIVPLLVPHRDEYSETIGFVINGPNKKVLFIPDIDKWERWSESIMNTIKSVDLAFVDATFYSNAEVGYRDVSEIPHPFVEESLALFKGLPKEHKNKIHFIHMNHTNPLLNNNSVESENVKLLGYNIAQLGTVFKL